MFNYLKYASKSIKWKKQYALKRPKPKRTRNMHLYEK